MDTQPYPYTQVQLDWLKALREHPERQTKAHLGFKTYNNEYYLCCLGQALLCLNPEIEFEKESGRLSDISDTSAKDSEASNVLVFSYQKLGLRSSIGHIVGCHHNNEEVHNSLTGMNDSDMTWPQIADYIEANPENVFTNHIPDFYKEQGHGTF